MGKKRKINKKKDNIIFKIYFVAVCIYIISALMFSYLVAPPVKKTSAQVYPGNTLDEALFLNQCNFYNFLLKANEEPRRLKCPEENE